MWGRHKVSDGSAAVSCCCHHTPQLLKPALSDPGGGGAISNKLRRMTWIVYKLVTLYLPALMPGGGSFKSSLNCTCIALDRQQEDCSCSSDTTK